MHIKSSTVRLAYFADRDIKTNRFNTAVWTHTNHYEGMPMLFQWPFVFVVLYGSSLRKLCGVDEQSTACYVTSISSIICSRDIDLNFHLQHEEAKYKVSLSYQCSRPKTPICFTSRRHPVRDVNHDRVLAQGGVF